MLFLHLPACVADLHHPIYFIVFQIYILLRKRNTMFSFIGMVTIRGNTVIILRCFFNIYILALFLLSLPRAHHLYGTLALCVNMKISAGVPIYLVLILFLFLSSTLSKFPKSRSGHLLWKEAPFRFWISVLRLIYFQDSSDHCMPFESFLRICVPSLNPFIFPEEAQPWMDDDRDYTYDELLQRVFNIMKDKNPEMVAGEKKKFVMRPPEVVKVGTKKTAFVNFTEIAKM